MPAQRHFHYIDALRGWAILAVIFVHASQQFPGLGPVLQGVTGQGARGVQLFFVVSALTLTMSWHERRDGVVPFYVRRFFRIAPMFWLAIIAFLLWDGFGPRFWAPNGISWIDVALTAIFLHGWLPESITSVVPGGWSIAVEMTFYAVFPLLMIACRSFWRTAVVFLMALALLNVMNHLAVFEASAQRPQYLVDAFKFFWFWGQLPVFIIGMAVFHALKWPVPAFLPVVAVCSSIVLMLLLPLDGHLPAWIRAGLPRHIAFGLAFGLLAWGLARGAGTIFVNKVTRFVGTVSFSAYLWHFMVLGAFARLQLELPSLPVFFVIVSAITVGISFLTYRLVEQPMIRAGSSLLRKQRASRAYSTGLHSKLPIKI